MKKSKFFILPAILLASQVNLNAQSYYQGIAGYQTLTFYAGANLFGNPLDNSPNGVFQGLNDLDTIFGDSGVGVPNGTTFSLWNSTSGSFGPNSVFNDGSWSIDLTLFPGTGAELITPSTFLETFTGYVVNFDGGPPGVDGSDVIFTPPPVFTGSNGTYLRSEAAPFNDVGSDIFLNIFGRLPNPGEQVTLLNSATQTYTTDTYLGNGSWDNVPTLNVGEAAYFNINSVPEPSTACAGLAGLGLAIFCCYQRRQYSV